jgi:hypothetical protein
MIFLLFRFKKSMIKRSVLFSCFLAFLIIPDTFSQSRLEIKNYFYDAESWILFEDYKEALPLYQLLLRVSPTNSNYKYRIGQCYINTPGEKEKAVSYLEDAVKNINPDYKEGKFNETKAPYDALYYLANAYRINNQIDKALETYKLFKKNLDPKVYDSDIVNFQIQSCINARDLMSKPLFIKESNLSSSINEGSSEFNPVISDDENMLVFSRGERFYDAILFSTKTKGTWSNPMNMNEILKVDKDLFPTSISKDGKTLYLYSSADYDGIIYSSKFENGSWSPITKLNDNINTKFWESHATISHDNTKLYFTSNRKGTLGGLDIYVSKRDSTGDWGPAENLGSVVNTQYNEESPFLSADDKTLFFSSRGHFNMGGYDIFYTTLLDNGQWSVPLNAGYPLNSTDDDVFFKPLKDGYTGYFAKESPGGYGKQDIYRIEIYSDEHPRKFLVTGLVKIADLLSTYNDSVRVSAMNGKGQTFVVYSKPATGEYKFELPHGDYQITYEGEGGKKITRNVQLPLTNPSDSFVLPGTILPKTDFVADLSVGTSKNISVTSGDSILFPIKAEPKSVLTVEHWDGDKLISTEQFLMTDSIFNYKMAPHGNEKVVFRLTDRFNNITTTEVFITKEKEQAPLIRPEYSRIIAKKQIEALSSMLETRSSEQLKKVIGNADLTKQKFGQVDDLISYLKEEAAKKGIKTEEVDKLALNVAVRDNILTQAAVDYLAKYTDGELRKILEDLNIYDEKLKTWTDLQEYIMKKTNGGITPDELNKIAAGILADVDPTIASLREKILTYSKNSDAGTIIRESVATVDTRNIKVKGKWLQSFYAEVVKQGLSPTQMADLLAAIAELPGTTAQELLDDLIEHAEEPLLSALRAIDLKKEKIRTSADLISWLLANEDKVKYPEDLIFKAISNLITSNDIPADKIVAQEGKGKMVLGWIIPVLLLAGLLLFLLLFRRRKKDGAEKNKR